MITSRHRGIGPIARGGFHKCQEIEWIFIDYAYLVFTTLAHHTHAVVTNLPEHLTVERHETRAIITYRHRQDTFPLASFDLRHRTFKSIELHSLH